MTKQQAIDTVNRYLKLLLTDFPECVKMMTDDFRLGRIFCRPRCRLAAATRAWRDCNSI